MIRVFLTCFFLFVGTILLPALEKDTLSFPVSLNTNIMQVVGKKSYSGFVIPAVCITYGVLAHNQTGLRRLDRSIHREVSKHFTGRIHADDYIQYVPAVAAYGLDWLGVKAKHNLKDRTFLMASSYLFSTVSVQTVKRATHIRRPDGANTLSFPSGHTATSFVGAHLLYKEYKDVSSWVCVAGYLCAGATGTIRMLNRKHWLSDVVAGAGVGILSVEVSYLLLPVFQQLTGVKESQTNVAIAPVFGYRHIGVGLACSF